MSKDLIIIEAPGKLSSYKKYLGSSYEVVASAGHIADLPPKKIGVNIKKDFDPTYETMDGKQDVVNTILKAADKADNIYIMTDSDREGEAIAWHIYRYLPKDKNIRRATTNSITKKEILDAISNSRDIDYDMVYSYEARRILDRLVGYKCSYVTQSATGGKSAGRVQSATLKILAEREKEIRDFIPQEYWNLNITLKNSKNETFNVNLLKPKTLDISKKEMAENIKQDLESNKITVSSFTKKQVKDRPQPPFITSSLLRSASTIFGWGSSRTMQIAQKNYEGGYQTYHRTDSVFIVDDFIKDIRNHISSNYGSNYLPSSNRYYGKQQKNAQEAHEACRSTSVTPQTISGDHARMLDLVHRRTVASQMEDAVIERVSAKIVCKDYLMSASGANLIFDGYRKVWTYASKCENNIPDLNVDEELTVDKIDIEQKFTTPPSRFSEASLIDKMKDAGIGRPSTYASSIKTLVDRGYIEIKNRSITVTDLGVRVSDFLSDVGFCFIDTSFTANMEEKLDDISSQKTTKLNILTDYWDRLQKDIENAKKIKEEKSKTTLVCPECGKNLLFKIGKNGPFLSCEDYSNKENKCTYSVNANEDGTVKETKIHETPCNKCGGKMIEKQGKLGVFYGCENYPKCKNLMDKNGKFKDEDKKYHEKPCPKCGSRMVERKGKKGTFYGCEGYPKCKSMMDTDGNVIENKFKKKSYKKYSKKKK